MDYDGEHRLGRRRRRHQPVHHQRHPHHRRRGQRTTRATPSSMPEPPTSQSTCRSIPASPNCSTTPTRRVSDDTDGTLETLIEDLEDVNDDLSAKVDRHYRARRNLSHQPDQSLRGIPGGHRVRRVDARLSDNPDRHLEQLVMTQNFAQAVGAYRHGGFPCCAACRGGASL